LWLNIYGKISLCCKHFCCEPYTFLIPKSEVIKYKIGHRYRILMYNCIFELFLRLYVFCWIYILPDRDFLSIFFKSFDLFIFRYWETTFRYFVFKDCLHWSFPHKNIVYVNQNTLMASLWKVNLYSRIFNAQHYIFSLYKCWTKGLSTGKNPRKLPEISELKLIGLRYGRGATWVLRSKIWYFPQKFRHENKTSESPFSATRRCRSFWEK